MKGHIPRFHLYEMFRRGKSIETEYISFFQGLKDSGFLSGVMKIFWNYMVVIVTQLCDYDKNHYIVLRVTIIAHEL